MPAVIVRTAHGPMLVPPYDQYVARSLILQGVFSPAEFATWRPYLPVGGVVIEVGANVGAHTIPFAAAVGHLGKVIAFEPQADLAHCLAGSLALNGIRNVQVLERALGAVNELVAFPDVPLAAAANFGGFEADKHWETRVYDARHPICRVACDRLDDSAQFALVDRLGECHFLKIDVEGMEFDVLRGAEALIASARPVIAAEADREQEIPALLGWFRAHRYRLWWHKPPLGPAFPGVISINLLAIPEERLGQLPTPTGDVVAIGA